MLSEHDYECATCGMMASEHIGVTSMCKVLRAVSSRESSLLVERDKLKRELAAVTEQRDRLAKALREIEWSNDSQWQANRAKAVLQSLTPNAKP
jgi:hypothetical protein